MTKTRLRQIEKRIERIKSELVKIEAMRPGSLTKQYKDPRKQTGPYYQLSYTLDMRSRTEYIRKEYVRELCKRQSHQVIIPRQSLDDFAACIVRVRNKIVGFIDGNDHQQADHFIEQGAFGSV